MKKDIDFAISFSHYQSWEQKALGMYASAVFGALLIKLVKIIVARPQNEIIEWVECLDSIKHFVLNSLIIQFLIFMAVPFADTQPILTIAEGVHPFIHDTSVEQMVDGQMHVTEAGTAPEAQTKSRSRLRSKLRKVVRCWGRSSLPMKFC